VTDNKSKNRGMCIEDVVTDDELIALLLKNSKAFNDDSEVMQVVSSVMGVSHLGKTADDNGPQEEIEEDDENGMEGEESDEVQEANALESAIRSLIAYTSSSTSDPLQLPPMSKVARKVIHSLASDLTLISHAIGSGDERRIEVHRFQSFNYFDVSIAEAAVEMWVVKYNAFKEPIRGYVYAYSGERRGEPRWRLSYQDGTNQEVEIEELNTRINDHYNLLKEKQQRSSNTARTHAPTSSSRDHQGSTVGASPDDELLSSLLGGISLEWVLECIKYDPRHGQLCEDVSCRQEKSFVSSFRYGPL
jgi:hypothetical protein